MMEQEILIFVLLFALAMAAHPKSRHDARCGKQVLHNSSGVITTPRRPKNTPCKWFIVAEPGREIKLTIRAYWIRFLSSDVTRRRFQGSITVYDANNIPGRKKFTWREVTKRQRMTYYSKHHIVVIRFRGRRRARFRINYERTASNGPLCRWENFYYTTNFTCTGNVFDDDYYSTCEILSCNDNFERKATTVNCVNGRFLPSFPCDLNEEVLDICYNTGLGLCPYSISELEHYARREEVLDHYYKVCETLDGEQKHKCLNLDNFPDLAAPTEDNSCPDCDQVFTKICRGKNFSYCARHLRTSEYIFNCSIFSNIESYTQHHAELQKQLCYDCRKIGCKRIVYW